MIVVRSVRVKQKKRSKAVVFQRPPPNENTSSTFNSPGVLPRQINELDYRYTLGSLRETLGIESIGGRSGETKVELGEERDSYRERYL